MEIHWYKNEKVPDDYRVIYFEVVPHSIDYSNTNDWKEVCLRSPDRRPPLDLEALGAKDNLQLRWTYSVTWKVRRVLLQY